MIATAFGASSGWTMLAPSAPSGEVQGRLDTVIPVGTSDAARPGAASVLGVALEGEEDSDPDGAGFVEGGEEHATNARRSAVMACLDPRKRMGGISELRCDVACDAMVPHAEAGA